MRRVITLGHASQIFRCRFVERLKFAALILGPYDPSRFPTRKHPMKILEISAGRERSVALDDEGNAYGWGGVKLLGATLPPGYPGELCTSSPTEIGRNRYAQPIPQRFNPGMPFSLVADGYIDTLGVRKTGDVLSCRPVVSKEHGADRAAIAGVPRAPIQLAHTESGAFALYADGTVWSWGMKANGQLGRDVAAMVAGPGVIDGLKDIVAIAAGHGHVLALDRGGKLWSWGANAAGQLGKGDLQQTAMPTRIDIPLPVKRIAAGDTHSFAIDAMDRLWGWGSNNHGQVGEMASAGKPEAYFTRPHRVKTGFAVAQVDAGMFYSVATSTQGDVFAWGWNGMAQIAQEGVPRSAKPMRVKRLANVTRLAARVGHTLALNDSGVFAWGDNRSSACGVFPSVAAQVQPVRVSVA
jgi:alpha-tubulin suppressor-like RCC1 family protein